MLCCSWDSWILCSSRSREAREKRCIHNPLTVPVSVFSCFVSLDTTSETVFCLFVSFLLSSQFQIIICSFPNYLPKNGKKTKNLRFLAWSHPYAFPFDKVCWVLFLFPFKWKVCWPTASKISQTTLSDGNVEMSSLYLTGKKYMRRKNIYAVHGARLALVQFVKA